MKSIRNAEDFTKAYDALADAIFRHCYFRVSDRERAKELMQETFIRAWNYIVDGHTIEQPKAFLYRVAHNLIVDEYRSRRGEASLDDLREKGFDVGTDARDALHAKIEAADILGLLDKIGTKYQEVIILRYIDGLGPKEIAKVIGESENAVSVRIHRGVRQIKKLLDKKR